MFRLVGGWSGGVILSTPFPGMLVADVSKPDPISSYQVLASWLALLVSRFRYVFNPQIRFQSVRVGRPSKPKLSTSRGLRGDMGYTTCALMLELLFSYFGFSIHNVLALPWSEVGCVPFYLGHGKVCPQHLVLAHFTPAISTALSAF